MTDERVPSGELTADDLPMVAEGWSHRAVRFAHTFDGYAHVGGGGPAALWDRLVGPALEALRVTGQLPDLGLDDLRAIIFYLARADRQGGGYGLEGDQLALYIAALEHIRLLIIEQDAVAGTGAARVRSRLPVRQLESGRPNAASSADAISVPADLDLLHRDWLATGRPSQQAFSWPRGHWISAFPEHRDLFARLRPRIDRKDARAVAGSAYLGRDAAVDAFLVTMAWGYGNVGYGPHRTSSILSGTPDAADRLHTVAETLAADGPVAAYARLGGDCRLHGLGPSFGTKYLAFCQPPGASPVALILDNLVLGWLVAHGRADLNSADWSVRRYESYLLQARAWADDLGCDAETVEWLIFQAASNDRGNQ